VARSREILRAAHKNVKEPTTTGTPILSARNLSKTFGLRTVLRNVDLDVFPGEIHGLVGQNGSGKSTLIKILAGYHEPDEGGLLTVREREVSLPLSSQESRRLAMSFVHQDLALIESATVLENIRIGRYERRLGWWVPWRRERLRVAEMLERFGIRVSPDALISELRQVDRAMVAIARALEQVRESEHEAEGAGNALLVLDEPTPHLPRDGVERLFDTVREMASSGVGILFVTHRLEEIRDLTHRVSVLRDGSLVENAPTESITEARLIESILGFSLEQLYPDSHEVQGELAIKAEGISGANVAAFSVAAQRGEIIGLTGLLGMGWEAVPYLLFGAQQATAGTLTLDGTSHDLTRLAPRRAMNAGLALIPADRHGAGVLLAASVAENMTLPTLGSYFSAGVLHLGLESRRARELMDEYDVRPRDHRRPLSTFSGGNQQKVVLAKWFETRPRVLLLHEPTQGVDVGARAQIFERIRDAAQNGVVVLYASAEWDDLAHLCDRVMIFRDGRVVSELRGAGLTSQRIAEQSFRDFAAQGNGLASHSSEAEGGAP
jgi:ribose transport system ATP-binding protein